MEEKIFSEKNSRGASRILIPIVLIILLLIGGFTYCKIKTTPENIFKEAVQKTFDAIEIAEDNKTAKASMKITADINSQDEMLQEVSQYLGNVAITTKQEIDIQKEVVKYNIIGEYESDKVIDANMLIQDGRIYVFAQEFFSKYVQIVEDEDMQEFNTILAETFEKANRVSKRETNKLIDEIEKAILKYLDKQEYSSSKEEIKAGIKTVKTTKSTIVLNEKELATLFIEVLTVLKENDYFIEIIENSEIDVKEEIEYLIEDLSEVEATEDNELIISLYTKGFAAELVKAEAIIEEYDEEILTITYVKEHSTKSAIILEEYDEEIKLNIEKKDKNTTVYELELPEELDGAEMSLEHKEDSENKGALTLNCRIPASLTREMDITGPIEAKLNIEYEIDTKVKVEKENVSNAITINEFTKKEKQELLENLQESKLFELISPIISSIQQAEFY